LLKEGDNNYRYDGNAQDEIEAQPVKVIQGAIESSNISVVSEMTKMIESHRMYETINKMMRTIDELDGEATMMGTAD
jgi:flagellar basal-body rod protein FlgG